MRKALLGIVAVGVGLVWLWPSSSPQQVADGSGHEVLNRVWIERLPTTPRDKINTLLIIEDPAIGIFQSTSAYEGEFTLFQWQQGDRGELRIHMLQTDKHYKLRARVSERGCEGFDLCLTVKGAPRGPKKYVSMRDWVIGGGELHPEVTQELLRELSEK